MDPLGSGVTLDDEIRLGVKDKSISVNRVITGSLQKISVGNSETLGSGLKSGTST